MGFLSTSYAAQVTPHLALASRFGVNVYSYESDLCLGGEWWIGKGSGSWIGGKDKGKERGDHGTSELDTGNWPSAPPISTGEQDRDGLLKAKVSGNGVSWRATFGSLAGSLTTTCIRFFDPDRLPPLRITDTSLSGIHRGHLRLDITFEPGTSDGAGSTVSGRVSRGRGVYDMYV
jgi:hypothetical protein